MEYEYLVCQTQSGRVTFVNGEWQGTVSLASGDPGAFDSCPQVWDYLAAAGRDGWELISAVNMTIVHGEVMSQLTSQLFLKRQLR